MTQTVHVLDRRHLQLLAAVERHGRLATAAQEVHISASAASHRLAEAERRVGVALVERAGRSLRLTPAGQHLAEVAASVEVELEHAVLRARWLESGHQQRVRVVVGFYDTLEWFAEGFRPHPGDVPIELSRVDDPRVLDAIRSRTADVAVAPWPMPPEGHRNVLLADDELVAVVPASGDLAERDVVDALDLRGRTYLAAAHQPRRGFEFHEFFIPAEVVPSPLVPVGSLQTVIRLVARGEGVTIQPSASVAWRDVPDGVALRPLAGPPIRVRWYASTLRGDHRDDQRGDGPGDGPDHAVDTIIERFRTVFDARHPAD